MSDGGAARAEAEQQLDTLAEEIGGFRVYDRDMGVKRTLLENGSWEEARVLHVEKVRELSNPGKKRP